MCHQMSDSVSSISLPRKPTAKERTEVKIRGCHVVFQVSWMDFFKQRL